MQAAKRHVDKRNYVEDRPTVEHHIPVSYFEHEIVCKTLYELGHIAECCMQALDWPCIGRVSEVSNVMLRFCYY